MEGLERLIFSRLSVTPDGLEGMLKSASPMSLQEDFILEDGEVEGSDGKAY
jgi:hypothetical protein